MIFGRPLKKVLGKIIPFGRIGTIHPQNLGTGVRNGTNFLRDDGVWSDINGSIIKVNGSFIDLTNQPLTSGSLAAVRLGTTLASNGVHITNGSKITVDYNGIYNLQFSLQLKRTTGGGAKQAVIWIRVDGVDVPNSATHMTFQASSDYLVPAWNFVIDMLAGQYVQLMWTQDDAIELITEVANTVVPYPAVPSVILTMTKIN